MRLFLFILTLIFPYMTYACSSDGGFPIAGILISLVIFCIAAGIFFFTCYGVISFFHFTGIGKKISYGVYGLFMLWLLYSTYSWLTSALLCI